MWQRAMALAALLLLTCSAVLAKDKPEQQKIPALVIQARFVYVTTYDGPIFLPNVLPAQREALVNVEDALMKWGRYQVVYRAQDADLILMVFTRGSEDVLAVYEADRGVGSAPLWWRSAKGGLSAPELPLLKEFQKQVSRQAETEGK